MSSEVFEFVRTLLPVLLAVAGVIYTSNKQLAVLVERIEALLNRVKKTEDSVTEVQKDVTQVKIDVATMRGRCDKDG